MGRFKTHEERQAKIMKKKEERRNARSWQTAQQGVRNKEANEKKKQEALNECQSNKADINE